MAKVREGVGLFTSEMLAAWPWTRGMVAIRVSEPPFISEGVEACSMIGCTHVVLGATESVVLCHAEAFTRGSMSWEPDLNDAGTVGHLRDMVRMVAEAPNAFAVPPGALSTQWEVHRHANTAPLSSSGVLGRGNTEADAWLNAWRQFRVTTRT